MTITVGNVMRVSGAEATNTTPAVDVDSGVMTVKYEDPGGTITTKIYGTDAEVVKDSNGHYHLDIPVNLWGTWNYRFIGTGANACAGQGRFDVEQASC